jgi:8-amino-7-oxononanoate synthase
MAAAAATAALQLLEEDWSPVERLRGHIARLRRGCESAGLALMPSQTAIQPLVMGDAQRALDAAAALLDGGHFVPAIRPPTVPEGTSRLRISLSAAHSDEDIDGLLAALAQVARA